MTKKTIVKYFVSLGIINSVSLFVWLVLTPSLNSDLFFLNYSQQRFILILLMLIIIAIFTMGLILTSNSKIIDFTSKIFQSKITFCLGIVLSLICTIIIVGLLLNAFGPGAFLFVRLLPVIIFGFLESNEILVFQQIYEFGETRVTIKRFLSVYFINIIKKIITIYRQIEKKLNNLKIPNSIKTKTDYLIKKSSFLYILSLVIAIVVFLKNAWVSDDAYIIYRSIEQLFAGNGPIWNPNERVQVFTSPLWFGVLSIARIFSHDVYLNAIVVSLILWILTIVFIRKIFKNNGILLIATLLFTMSNGFYDFTSSGLENVFAYFLITAYLLNFVCLFSSEDVNRRKIFSNENLIKFVLILYGLIICVRYDLALILLPATIYVIVKKFQTFPKRHWLFIGIVALAPFILFSLFSLAYYGFPFPNTAYAKLNTDISQIDLIAQGAKYFYSSLKYDTLTLVIIFGSLFLNLFIRAKTYLKYLSAGIILNLLYILYIGGDFMQGRFFSYAYLISVIILLLRIKDVHFSTIQIGTLATVGILFVFFFPHLPMTSTINYETQTIDMGIADERGHYFNYLSLYRYLISKMDNEFFPDKDWAKEGIEFKASSDKVTIKQNIGLFGYYSGTKKIIIDPLALGDPLLARMPVVGSWRIGHFTRNIPDGYIDSVINGNDSIVDPKINEFYKYLKIVTESKKLFTVERLKTIFMFNIGAYNYLVQGG